MIALFLYHIALRSYVVFFSKSFHIVYKYYNNEGMNDMEFSKSPVSVCEQSKQIKTKTNLEADVIVPDTKPDIYRVLNVKALPDVTECYMKKDKIIFSGKTKFTILYVGEGDMGKICSIEYSLPFNHVADMTGAEEGTVARSSCNISSTAFDIKNSRKLSVGAALDLCADSLRMADVEVIDGEGETTDVPFLSEQRNFDCLAASEDFNIELSDTLILPTTNDECEIYDVDIRPNISEIKAVNNKAIVKGNANITVLYFADNEISSYDTEATFTEIIDISSLSSEQTVVSHFEVAEVSYSALPSENGINLELDAKLKGNISAYESKECTLTTDIYSPDYSYDVKSRRAKLLHIEKCPSQETTIKDNITLSAAEPPICKIHYMDALISSTSAKKERDSIRLEGNVENIVIYSDEEQNLNRIRHTTPFNIELECKSICDDAIIDADISCANHSFALASGREIQTRVTIKANVKLTCLENVTLITDFNVDTSTPINKNSQAGIVVFYPSKGTDIWSVAKKYNTTCEEIIKINSLDASSTTLGDKPILIPKRQSR